jgi:hypothetical protein
VPAEGNVKDKIAIIGKAPSSRGLGPWDDHSWEVWTLSDLVPQGQVPRWDRHFELHPLHFVHENPEYWKWLTQPHDNPIYVQEVTPEIPAGVPYPIQDVLAHFPVGYFNNSVSYMIALAIMTRPKFIGVWGVDMAQTQPVLGGSPEYQSQRPSCEWLLGVAMGAGIEVVLPAESDLMKAPYLYGFGHKGNSMRRKWEARTEELTERIANKQKKLAEFQEKCNQLVAHIHQLQGALDSQQYYEQWTLDDACEPASSQPPPIEP